MRALFRDRWDAPHGHRGGRPRPAPEPTPRERQIVLALAASDCPQVAIADVLNVPRTRIRIWYRCMGLGTDPDSEAHALAVALPEKLGPFVRMRVRESTHPPLRGRGNSPRRQPPSTTATSCAS